MKFREIINPIIAFVLLVSTVGVVVNKHYSGGKLFSTALYVNAESCCSGAACCCDHDKDGCREERDFYRLISDYTVPEDSGIKTIELVDIFTYSFIQGFIYAELNANAISKNIALHIIKPPPITTDIPVLFHSLLI